MNAPLFVDNRLPSLQALGEMSLLLQRHVLDAQMGWTASDDHSSDAGMGLVRTAQRTYEQFLRRYGLLAPRRAR